MAFWAMKKHSWFKRKIPNMIYLYRKKLYDDWFNSLPEEKQKQILKKKEKERIESEKSFIRLLAMTEALKLRYGMNKF